MDVRFVADLAKRLGTKIRVEGSMMHAIVQHGDAWIPVRFRGTPFGELFATPRPLDGFELTIKWNDRGRDPAKAIDFDHAFDVETNDVALAAVWLDDTARAALLASAYTFRVDDVSISEALGLDPGSPGYQPATTARRTWTYELRDRELCVTKGSAEQELERLAVVVTTAAAVAARAERWAAEYAELAPQLGAGARTELDLGGGPILTATRDAVDVEVRLARRADGAPDRLRTQLVAARAGAGAGRLALVDRSLPRAARAPTIAAGRAQPLALADYELHADHELAARLDDLAKKLVMLARPAAVTVDPDRVQVWLDAAPRDHARLDAAIALVAHLAVDAVATHGPYR